LQLLCDNSVNIKRRSEERTRMFHIIACFSKGGCALIDIRVGLD